MRSNINVQDNIMRNKIAQIYLSIIQQVYQFLIVFRN